MSLKKDFVPSQRWNLLYTTGQCLMTKALAVPMTVGNDYALFTVPKGERWVVFELYMVNNSGQAVGNSCYIRDSNSVPVGYLFNGTLNNGVYDNTLYTAYHYKPFILYEGQTLVFLWAAAVGKAGTSYCYVNCLQFDVGKGT